MDAFDTFYDAKADKRRAFICRLVQSLSDRGGFDDWWANIDHDTQVEILESLEETFLGEGY